MSFEWLTELDTFTHDGILGICSGYIFDTIADAVPDLYIMSLLVRQGFDVHDHNAMIKACKFGHIGAIEFLENQGVRIRNRFINIAFEHGQVDVLRYFSHKIDICEVLLPTIKSFYGTLSIDAFEYILSLPQSNESRYYDSKKCLLDLAYMEGDKDIPHLLISKGVLSEDVLVWATLNDDLNTVRLLVENGAMSNFEPAIRAAKRKSRYKILKFFAQKGAYIN
jgi:hypothetical protein